mgnify:CR=1 FL=1
MLIECSSGVYAVPRKTRRNTDQLSRSRVDVSASDRHGAAAVSCGRQNEW